MAEERGNLVPVASKVVLETLVAHMYAVVEERRTAGAPSAAVVRVLQAPDLEVADGGDPSLDSELRHAGYLTRVVEAELFEPAQRPADWIPDLLRERFSATESWSGAVSEVSAELARAEPLGKPSPDDESANSWRIPGPGGHVRHYVARRTIEGHLSEGEAYYSVGDPAELKRPWIYGFFVRACEEALPPEAELEASG